MCKFAEGMSAGGDELKEDTGACLKRVWLVSREFRNRRKETGGVSAGTLGCLWK